MDPFIGQIVMFGGSFAPRGWALCEGQLLAISSHSALFSILGTIYGGDGRSTFGLPDLRSRMPVHSGDGNAGPGLRAVRLGQKGGRENHQLNVNEMPSHSHNTSIKISDGPGDTHTPTDNALAAVALERDLKKTVEVYVDNPNYASGFKLGGVIEQPVGGNQSFSILPPYLGINFIIALEGVFPSRS